MPAAMTLGIAGALGITGISWDAQAAGDDRALTFYNVNTKETVTIKFMRDGNFLPDGMKQINYIMRDWRRDEPTEMDPELINTIWELYQKLGSKEPSFLAIPKLLLLNDLT